MGADGGVKTYMAIPNVIIQEQRDWDRCQFNGLVWLEGFKDRFVFALRVTDEEFERSLKSDLFDERIEKAKSVLLADWERAGKPQPDSIS